ncbi:type IV pilus modification PilV family protein [Mucisphaera sp.]|uniref:type IV pilus modification PilV family protein n=1 Tax=Mucisphaera sp. TaxID=2913024 RepID=UPI003D0F7A53
MAATSPRPRRAFTLLETLIAASILAIITLALTQAMAAGHMQTNAALEQARATTLLEAMIEEALILPYPTGTAPTGVLPPTRNAFTDLRQYHDYTEAPGTLVDHAGTTLPLPYQNFQRTVTIAENTTTAIADLGITLTGLTVVVQVSLPDGRNWSAGRFIPDPNGGI